MSDVNEVTNASVAEQRLWQAVHVYEVVKLAMLTALCVLSIGIGVLVLINQAKQIESLKILKCAVSQEVQDARAKAGTDIEARDRAGRAAYNACVERGGPR